MSTRHVYNITGMTCDHCAVTIKNALERLSGVSAEVSFEERKAIIDAPESLDPGILAETIRNAGYGLTDHEGSQDVESHPGGGAGRSGRYHIER